MPELISAFDLEFTHRFDFFIVDQWGVLHNGISPDADAQAVLKMMVQQHKPVITLSNSSKPIEATQQNLQRLGYEMHVHYHQIVTSGSDVARCYFEKVDDFYQNLGQCGYVIGFGRDRTLSQHLGLQETDDIENADFIFCSGINNGAQVSDYDPILSVARKRNLPMICANPDEWTVREDLSLHPCPGAIAKHYEKAGGRVRWHGKPRIEAYQSCFALLKQHHGIDYQSHVGLAIGDSLAHDILGGANAGLKTLLIAQGIHRHQISLHPERMATHNQSLFQQFGVTPTFVAEKLRLS